MGAHLEKGKGMTETPFDFSDIKFVDDKLDADPAPKSPPKKAAPKTGAKSTPRSTNTKTRAISELQENIEGFLTMIAVPLKMRDIHPDGSSCADVIFTLDQRGMTLTDNTKQLAFALAQVGVDNKYISAFFSMGDNAGKWVLLLQALQPMVMTVYGNHAGGRSNAAADYSVA